MTERQEQVIGLLARESPVSPQRVAGEFGMRSQDAGRVLSALERKGVVEFVTGPPTGYRLTSLDSRVWDDEPEIDSVRFLMLSEIDALIENADSQVWIYSEMAKHAHDDPDKARDYLALSKWYMRRRRIFYELKAEIEREIAELPDA